MYIYICIYIYVCIYIYIYVFIYICIYLICVYNRCVNQPLVVFTAISRQPLFVTSQAHLSFVRLVGCREAAGFGEKQIP